MIKFENILIIKLQHSMTVKSFLFFKLFDIKYGSKLKFLFKNKNLFYHKIQITNSNDFPMIKITFI